MGSQATRKQRGAWYTPTALVDVIADRVASAGSMRRHREADRTVRVLDPACGDGRLLIAVADRLAQQGLRTELVGCDISDEALAQVDRSRVRCLAADALTHRWGDEQFDVVVGNPPFLSQMDTTTTRGGASRHGGGPYADAAVEFLALSTRLCVPNGGIIALVLPQSILGARDAGPVRDAVDRCTDLAWSWWEQTQDHFDAAVNVCVLGFETPATEFGGIHPWTRVVTDVLGIPELDSRQLSTDGTLGGRALLNANFRDEYYALVPAVSDDADGPPLVTSGLIDPGRCYWGERPVKFAKQTLAHPRVDLSKLTGRFPAWAARKLVPKVLVANQTKVIEAVADPDGAWLPGVPVTTATPHDPAAVFEIAAALTSPIATVLAWQAAAGTGMSTTAVRLSPASLGGTPWPSGNLERAVSALQAGDLVGCGTEVCLAYGLVADGPDSTFDELISWWSARLPAAKN